MAEEYDKYDSYLVSDKITIENTVHLYSEKSICPFYSGDMRDDESGLTGFFGEMNVIPESISVGTEILIKKDGLPPESVVNW